MPLSLYFKDGRAKLEVGLGRGRREIDKRQVIAKREADREARRAMVRGRQGDGLTGRYASQWPLRGRSLTRG